MKCRLCGKQTEAFMRIPTGDLDEPFLDARLRRELPELKLRRCPRCACLWADDARHDDEVLAGAYERVSESYFDAEPCDPRYTRFYENIEEALKRYARGRTILDVGCGDGIFLNRSEEHTSELQSHSFISYPVFCFKKKVHTTQCIISMPNIEYDIHKNTFNSS